MEMSLVGCCVKLREAERWNQKMKIVPVDRESLLVRDIEPDPGARVPERQSSRVQSQSR